MHDEQITPRDVRDAERIEMDPQAIMRLIDLIFLGRDEASGKPS